MAKTTDQITVDPQGQSMVVDIFDSNGVSVTCYTARAGSSAFTLPVTISTPTTFYLTSSGYYSVSAKVGGVEIAGVAGQQASVQAGYGVPVTVTPTIDVREALAALGSGSAASSAPWPRQSVRVDSTDGGTTFSVQVIAADGTSTVIPAAGDASGVPWFKWGADGQLYVVSAAHYSVQVSLAPTTADDSVACNTNGGLGLAVGAAVSASIGGGGSGELFGTPAGGESGGPAAEPGWDLLYVYTNSGAPSSITARIWALDLPDPIPS